MRGANALPDAAASSDPLYPIDRMLGELDRAAANPAEAEQIFDNLKRRYGSIPGGGVPVDFTKLRKETAATWTYTPKGAPGTNEARARDLSREVVAPGRPKTATDPAAAVGERVDYAALMSLSAGRAADALGQSHLPDGAERRFAAERGERLKELYDVGRLTIKRMGGDPDTFRSLGDVIAHLLRQEAGLAATLKLGDHYQSMDEVMLRVSAIKNVNRELGAFMATLWEYRAFLRMGLVAAQVPLETRFEPWETFPDGQGTKGAQVVGYKRGVTQFVGLRYDNADGGSRFQGQAKNGKSGLILVVEPGTKIRTESLINYDGEGKVRSALTEIYDGQRRTRRESLDMGANVVEVVEYKADGTEARSTRRNTKSGEQFVRDLAKDDGRFEATTLNGRREIRFLKDATGAEPAVTMRVEKVGLDGSFQLERLVLQNGTHIVAKSAHVNQLLEKGTKNLGWEVALKSLVEETDARKRLTTARALAKEAVTAVGMVDQGDRLSRPLGAFLAAEAKNTGDLVDPSKGAPIRFFINENKNYLLIFTRRDGTKRILSGSFKQSTEWGDNYGLGMAFGVAGEIDIDADNKATQREPKIETEYLYDGSRLVWMPP
ncbi:MAG: hypothetical protein M0D55_10325 [Elusimicrobiota bacterium]|nr:MAG: hypothetical protein M0D55_10325 [Elusimicrobiota bacterium]